LRTLEEVAVPLEDAYDDATLLEREGEGKATDPSADNRHRQRLVSAIVSTTGTAADLGAFAALSLISTGADLGADLALQFGGDLNHRHEPHAVASIAPHLRRGRARSPLAQHSGPMTVARKADAVLVDR
jgi:hypothetical protein